MTKSQLGKTFLKKNNRQTRLVKKHHNELKAAFNYDVEFDYKYFEIAETLTECICEYPHFLWSGDVRYIDKVYVIIIIF